MKDPARTYRRDRTSPRTRFDELETTISHLFRRPHPALGGRSYGAALYTALTKRGLVRDAVFELGAGAGFVAAAMHEAAAAEGRSFTHTFLELSPLLLALQRTQVPGAFALAAHAEQLPFRSGALEGLFLANEVLADLRVADVGEAESLQLVARYGLDLADAQLLNVGALHLVEELARTLAPGSTAVLTEFGGDFPAAPVDLGGAFVRGRHVEHSIHFGHLEAAARNLGLSYERVPLAELLEMDLTLQVASYPDVMRLRRWVPSLPVLAHPREELEARHPFLTRFFRFEFPAIGAPSFPNRTSRGGFAQLFFALLLRRAGDAQVVER
ncbi:MAG: hypothetical protein ACOZIN_15495 [Myxococcota bacterium]